MKKIVFLLAVSMFVCASYASAMTRTLKKDPAVVIAAFGTTTKAKATYDFFNKQLIKELPPEYASYKIEWAFTSEIIREIANKRFKKQGVNMRYKSLSQVLSNLEDEGYRNIAIQPLHIFPGQEYKEMLKVIKSFSLMDLRIIYGGTLFDRWDESFEVIDVMSKDFIDEKTGCNVLVAHGSPLTYVSSNSTYLGLDRYVSRKYDNVFMGSVDGVLTKDQALTGARGCKHKKIRFLTLMYVAGDHIMNDIMGKDPKEPSWAMEMEKDGFAVEAASFKYNGKKYHKGLGFYKDINSMFIHSLVKSLDKLTGKVNKR